MSGERRDAEITDLKRRLSNTTLIGTISQVDHEKGRYRVKSAEIETDWLPMMQPRGGGTSVYESYEEGETVVVQSVAGDLSQGVIIGALYKDETQAGKKGSQHVTKYPDGTVIEYDHESSSYSIAVAGGGSVTITCEVATINASAVNLGGEGGKKVARIGDKVNVGSGSSAGLWPIVEGSDTVFAVD